VRNAGLKCRAPLTLVKAKFCAIDIGLVVFNRARWEAVTGLVYAREHDASEEECARLKLRARQRVYCIMGVRRSPAVCEYLRLPSALFPRLPDQLHSVQHLADQYGLHLGEAEQQISIERASQIVSKALGVSLGTMIWRSDRVVQLRDCSPLEWRTTYSLDWDQPAKLEKLLGTRLQRDH
jgi:DNA-binding GntR family transcriptional regulator